MKANIAVRLLIITLALCAGTTQAIFKTPSKAPPKTTKTAPAENINTDTNNTSSLPATNSATATASSGLTNSNSDTGATSIPGNFTNAWMDLSFWSGARFSSPYTIDGKTKTLSPTGNSSDAYLEINLISSYVFRHGPLADQDENKADLLHKPIFPWVADGLFPWQHRSDTNADHSVRIPFPDLNISMGYLFRNSSGPSNYNASTIVGSSDFYLNTMIGEPLARWCSDTNGTTKFQLSALVSDGFTTDKQFIELHNTFFCGLGLEIGDLFKGPSGDEKQAYFFLQGGIACIDKPRLVNGTTTVEFNGLNQPEFTQDWVPTVGATFVFPLKDWVNVNAGVNAYFSHEPANWNANIGMTFDLQKIADVIDLLPGN